MVKAVRSTACSPAVYKLLCYVSRRPRILMLHGVGHADNEVATFRAQIAFLQRYFEIVPLGDILHPPRSAHSLRPRIALTFDDGLRNNYSVVWPILREFRAPATFFVCPGLIESRQWLWNHECRARLDSMPQELRRQFAQRVGLDEAESRFIVSALKYVPRREREGIQEEIREATPHFTPTEAQLKRYDIMTWQELRSLDPELIAVGAHTTHHEILTGLDAERLESEVSGCREWLERALHRPTLYFCYPDGAWNDRVVSYVERYFSLAVTTEEALVPRRPSPLRLPRIPLPDSPDLEALAWRMQRPTA